MVPKFNIPDVFSCIISTCDIKDPDKHKPSPYIAEEILKKYNLLPNDALVVGDSGNDVLMAQKADILPVVVLSGNLSKTEAKQSGVTYIIDDVTQIESVINELQ